jgi:anti-sigma B factor antagonist
MMQITARTGINDTVLELNGRLVVGTDVIELRNAVQDATASHPEKVILNLAKVTYADSCGIGELVTALKHVKNQGGRLILTNLPERIRILLDTAQLMKVFEVTDREQASIVDSRQPMTHRCLCF